MSDELTVSNAKPVEEHVKLLPKYEQQAVKIFNKWAIGKLLTQEEFDAGVKNFRENLTSK